MLSLLENSGAGNGDIRRVVKQSNIRVTHHGKNFEIELRGACPC